MKIRNLKGFALEIGVTGQVVEPGVEVDVDDALGLSLCEQVDVWAAVKPEPKQVKPADTEEQS